MKRITHYGQALVAMLLVSICASTATADWHEFWHNLHVGYYRNNAWPEPFNELDARDVVAPFEVMKHNGWKMHNTIGHEQFRNGDGALMASGSNKVRWIATQAPPNRRTIYVLRGLSHQETQARVASVQESLASIHPNGPRPTVMITDVAPAQASGTWAYKVNSEWLEQLAPPKLPNTSSNGTAGATQQ